MSGSGAGDGMGPIGPVEHGERSSEGGGPSWVRGWGKAFLRIALTVVVSWFIIRAVGLNLRDFGSLDLSRLQPRWGFLLLSSVILLLGYLYSASLWGLLVRELGGPDVGIGAALRVFFTANLGRYLPGKVWQLAGLAYLARREGVTTGVSTSAALLGQGYSLAGAALVGVGVFLGGGLERAGLGRWIVVPVLALLIISTFPGVLRPVLRALMKRVSGAPPAPDWPDWGFGIRWLGLYALGWVLQGAAFWILGIGMGPSMTLPLLLGVTVYPAAYLLGYLAIFAPAGFGVREGFLIAFLNPILGAGGAVLAVTARLWTLLIELLPALSLAGGYLNAREKEAGGDDRG